MKTKDAVSEVIEPLLAQLRPSKDELATLRKVESSGNDEAFRKALGELDRKYKRRGLERIEGLDERLINQKAARTAPHPHTRSTLAAAATRSSAALLADLLQKQEIKCDCVVPFRWTGLSAYGSMSGPNRNDVYEGILGAKREYSSEYTVANYGDTVGKGRVPFYGQLHMTFEAQLPQSGRWCLLIPAGDLWVRGHSKVVGHGNSTTSYDAKVWVDYYQLLIVGTTLLEISGGEIHYDGTRSESRTTYFNADLILDQRYLFLNGAAGDLLVLSFRVEVEADANEDGTAIGAIDYFGFPANTKSDYDTFLIKA